MQLDEAIAASDACAIEVDVTGFDPASQFADDDGAKHHMLSAYSQSSGERVSGFAADDSKAWLAWRVGRYVLQHALRLSVCMCVCKRVLLSLACSF